jgi:adenine-specific DNA glycosylase
VPIQSWGHKEKSKGSKNLTQKKTKKERKKEAKAMMLKIKRKKQKQRERAQDQHWEASWTILQIKSKVQKCMSKNIWDTSISDP